MEISRQRVRRDFAPLTVSVSVACASSASPLMQVYNAELMEYEPNRLLSPTLIRPEVMANAKDGSWPHPSANAQLANMKWYANGKDISTLADWNGLYEIDQVGSTRGSLTVYRNVAPGEKEIALHFEADLVDNRLGVVIPIKTDTLTLSTFDKSDDSYSLSVGDANNIVYNPCNDKLHLYEHKVAQGIISASASARAAALDGNEYICTIPIDLYKGGKKVDSGYTIKLYKVNGVNSFTEMTASDDEVISISNTAVSLDLRMIEKNDYLIRAFVNNVSMAQVQVAVRRSHPTFTASPTNATDILPSQRQRYDVAQVCSESKIIECPGSIFKLTWKTDTATMTGVTHNEGEKTLFSIEKTGIGNTSINDWMDVYIEAEQKDIYKIATDASGNIYTDEYGNEYIIN